MSSDIIITLLELHHLLFGMLKPSLSKELISNFCFGNKISYDKGLPNEL